MAEREAGLVPTGTELSAQVDATPPKKQKAVSWRLIGVGKLQKPKLKLPAINEVTWAMAWQASKDFFSDPMNVSLFVWALLSIPACLVIMAVKLGIFNKVLSAQQQEHAEEIATQIVNALFFLTCLIVFPLLCRHTFLLIRWEPRDKVELRQAFCKNGRRKPHDRTHMAVVVFWGQVTCWATFAFSVVYWVYPLGERPAWLVSITFVVSMVAPVVSLVYLLVSPLSKDYDIVKEGDADMLKMYQRTGVFVQGRKEIKQAEWNGTVFPGCCADRRVAWLTCLLPCCMFGYNMERLGFGHRVVHTLAFLIVLIGPVLVFEFSADALEELGVARNIVYHFGVLLALLGMAYGGAWRMKMRESYHLPGSTACCGSNRATDVCIWLWCGCCALCQEIRTTDQYQVEEESGYEYSQASENEAAEYTVVVVAPEDDDPEGVGAVEDGGEGGQGKTNAPPVQKMDGEVVGVQDKSE